MIASWSLSALTVCLATLTSVSSGSEPTPQATVKPQALTLETIYRSKPYAGQAAKGLEFSHDARYLAYLWNPYGEDGSDLYLHDTTTGQTRRVTSLAIMKAYDTPEALERFQEKAALRDKQQAEAQAQVEAQAAYLTGANVDLEQWEKAAIEVVKKEAAAKKIKDDAEKKKAEAEKKAEDDATGEKKAEKKAEPAKEDSAKTDPAKKDAKPEKEKELWEWRDEVKKKREKDKIKPADLYPGVSTFAWANKASELIFQYRGDLFRVQAADGKVERLTSTDRSERITAYTANDDGYYFIDETKVVKASFTSGRLV
ncbi:MAG: hypothetical protein Q8O00_10360, partial [Holophaga sp.]|nr:hypothetical protein [Holophaga sp.]